MIGRAFKRKTPGVFVPGAPTEAVGLRQTDFGAVSAANTNDYGVWMGLRRIAKTGELVASLGRRRNVTSRGPHSRRIDIDDPSRRRRKTIRRRGVPSSLKPEYLRACKPAWIKQ